MADKRRETKYTRAVWSGLVRRGHATNAELASVVRGQYPHVSDTTIHRITGRFLADGRITLAPPSGDDGAVRYDCNVKLHDHFTCQSCGVLKDTTIPTTLRHQLQGLVEGCCLNGSLLIVGDCKTCKE